MLKKWRLHDHKQPYIYMVRLLYHVGKGTKNHLPCERVRGEIRFLISVFHNKYFGSITDLSCKNSYSRKKTAINPNCPCKNALVKYSSCCKFEKKQKVHWPRDERE